MVQNHFIVIINNSSPVSRWLFFNAKWEYFFYLYYGEIKLHFDEMMIMTVLYLINTLNWILIVPAHWNNSSHVDMSLHFDTFWANQSLFLPLTVENLAEKEANTNFICFCLTWPEPNPWSTALKASTLTIKPPMRFLQFQLNHYRIHTIGVLYIYIYTHLISILFNIL